SRPICGLALRPVAGMADIALSLDTCRVPSRVVLFSTDACAYCGHARSLLGKRGVDFEEVNLGEHPQLQAELQSVTGLDSYPQILVDGETLGGLNELRAADKDGRLAAWGEA
ncbi:MAG: glutaredoxin 3, partial [Solirubrobacteraceae bacterium]|nr:glutaredoxin 3 [Solirubrobacteraceae bacterium]